jgi:hypothetical protein
MTGPPSSTTAASSWASASATESGGSSSRPSTGHPSGPVLHDHILTLTQELFGAGSVEVLWKLAAAVTDSVADADALLESYSEERTSLINCRVQPVTDLAERFQTARPHRRL